LRLLAIDALGPGLSVGVWRDGAAGPRRVDPAAPGRADGLAAAVAAVLTEAGLRPADLDAVAVATGPGGFTGARAGVAFARGLALAAGVPALGLSRFDVAAAGRRGPCVVTLAAGGAAWSQTFRDGVALGPPVPAAEGAAPSEPPVLPALARAALARLADGPAPDRPAPLYLRPPDAAPSAEAPPALLP
jgi:N6-L-threonylcarbamoyladenine synthase